MEWLYAKPHVPKLRLNYSFGSPRNEVAKCKFVPDAQ